MWDEAKFQVHTTKHTELHVLEWSSSYWSWAWWKAGLTGGRACGCAEASSDPPPGNQVGNQRPQSFSYCLLDFACAWFCVCLFFHFKTTVKPPMEIQSFPQCGFFHHPHSGSGSQGRGEQGFFSGRASFWPKHWAADARHSQTLYVTANALLSMLEISFSRDVSFSGCVDAGLGKPIRSPILCSAALRGTSSCLRASIPYQCW